jgi:glycerophosphoryl diester phosphodiesterase
VLLLDRTARPVIAHRGDRAHAPENTLIAFERAIAAGADALECDVHLTADGHVVVCHDPSVDRTTDGTGEIARMPVAAIRALNAGARWTPHKDPERANGRTRGGPAPFAFAGHRVPMLTELLDAFPGTPIIIELKSVAVAGPATEIVRARRAFGTVLLASFHDGAMPAPRAAGIATGASRTELQQLLPAALLRRRSDVPAAFNAIAMPPAQYGIPLPVGGYVRAADVPIHVWTVNDPVAARRYWRRGVCGIITDDPGVMVESRSHISG